MKWRTCRPPRRRSGWRSSCAARAGRCSCSCGRSRAPVGSRGGCRRMASGPARRTRGPVLVFVRTKSGAERLARRLSAFGIRAAALHADRTQQQRTAAVEGFRGGQYHVLVATDVAARGLDIDGITHVVNFEVPSSRETYVHRVGRTGRAAATGTALTLVAPEELRALQALQRTFGPELLQG